jgi:hypothetical protein
MAEFVDEFINVSNADGTAGALIPDGKDDNLATDAVKQIAANYKTQQANSANADVTLDPESQAQLDHLEFLLSQNKVDADKAKKDFQVKLTRATEVPAMFSEGQMQGGGTSSPPTGNYYDLTSDGFLELTNQTLIDKVTLASKDPTKRDAIYRAALARAAILQKSGKDTSVEEVLDGFIKNGVPGIDGAGGGPFSTTTRSISLTNEGTSRQLLDKALTGYLGRQATVEENSMFLKALNVQEKANPMTSVTAGNTSGRVTTQTQNTSGGFDRNDFTERFAKSQEGYAEYQTATTYLDAFIGALEDKSRVVG